MKATICHPRRHSINVPLPRAVVNEEQSPESITNLTWHGPFQESGLSDYFDADHPSDGWVQLATALTARAPAVVTFARGYCEAWFS
jgi:hypothetical protein